MCKGRLKARSKVKYSFCVVILFCFVCVAKVIYTQTLSVEWLASPSY